MKHDKIEPQLARACYAAQFNAERKIIQIAAIPASAHEEGAILALALDGTLWISNSTRDLTRLVWTEVPPLPLPFPLGDA